MKRIVVGDSRPSAFSGLEAALSATDGLQVVRTIDEADVLVLDLDAAESPNLLVRLKRLQPKLKVVGVGSPDDHASISSAFALGADGYHVRTDTPAELVAGLRRILLATEYTQVDSNPKSQKTVVEPDAGGS